MIKARFARTQGKADVGADADEVLLFGLSHVNLDRLRAGEPIIFDMAEIDLPPTQVVIFAAPTEQAIVDQFKKRGFVDDRTVIKGEADAS